MRDVVVQPPQEKQECKASQGSHTVMLRTSEAIAARAVDQGMMSEN